jgi:hypothetical protein
MKLLTPLLAVGLLLIVGCSEETPLQAHMPDPALEPILATSNPVMVPFRGAYDETFAFVPPNFEIHGEGVATHLGNSTFFSPLLPGDPAATGPLTFSAANGDELATSVVSFVSDPDANGFITFSGSWGVTGGSGRFENATGCGTFDGSGNVFTGVGQISFEGDISQPTGHKGANF